MAFAIAVDKESATPIYQQIYLCTKRAIASGDLACGEKLPSIRSLSAELEIARNTVDTAYRQLQVEGFVASKQGSGFVVQELPSSMLGSERAFTSHEIPAEQQSEPCTYDFRYGSLYTGSFPAEDWRKLISEILSRPNCPQLSSYGNEHGELGLREQISQHLETERGVICAPEQIIITSGTQQALELLCRLFDPETDRVCFENPGFAPARIVLESLGFKLKLASTEHGSKRFLSDIAKSASRLIYSTPSHQFPTGACLDVSSRMELIAHAESLDAYIIEDNYDSEFRYNAQPVPSLQSIDRLGRVIYVGTFSKALSPALRISYLVLPPRLVKRYKEHFQGFRCTVPWIEQETLRLFMERGLWEKHLHRSCIANRKRHDLLLECIRKELGPHVEVHAGVAGLFVLLDIKGDMTQAELVQRAWDHGIGITPAKLYWANEEQAPEGLVLLGFSAITEQAIEEGIAALAKAWFA